MNGTIRRLWPSPAMVVACIALVFAMTGAGYAAGMLGPNTVGTKQLRKNAVNSSKVKNGSLLRADFKSGQIPAGPQGPAGPPGAADSTKLGRVQQSTTLLNSSAAANVLTNVAQVSITVPDSVSQQVRVSGQTNWYSAAGTTCPCYGGLYLAEGASSSTGGFGVVTAPNNADNTTNTNEWVFTAAPGTHTYVMQIIWAPSAGAGTITIRNPVLQAEMFPFTGAGSLASPLVDESGPRRGSLTGAP